MPKKNNRLLCIYNQINIPNILSILRIFLAPFFVFLILEFRSTENFLFRYLAMLVFIIAVITDGLDGYIARTRNQMTSLGRFLDPIADKILILSASLVLTKEIPSLIPLPLWYIVIVLSRDLCIITGTSLIYFLRGKIEIQPLLIGKITTVLQMAVIISIIIKLPNPQFLWYLSSLFTFISAFRYILDGIRKARSYKS